MLSARFIGEVEVWIVAVKVAILLLFVVTGAMSIHINRLLPDQWSAPIQIIAGGMIIFLAYESFELIANLFDLSSISMMGSVGFLLVFAAVNGANVVLAEKTGLLY